MTRRRPVPGPLLALGLALCLALSPALTPAEARAEGSAVAQGPDSEADVTPTPPESGPSVSAAPGQGLSARSEDGNFAITLRARLQLRDTLVVRQEETTNEVQLRTLRFFVQGHVLDEHTRYVIQLAFGTRDFEPGNASPIFDAYLDFSHLRDLSLRVGQFFVPFDRARTIREFALQFVDRQAVVRELTLDRDVGLMLYAKDLFGWGGRLGYHLFVGGGEGRNQFGGEALGPLVVARLVLRPFGEFDDDQESDLTRAARLRLAWGVAGAYNHRTDRKQSTYGDAFTVGRVRYSHFATDLVAKYAGFSFLGELVLRGTLDDAVDGTVNGAPVREWSRQAGGYFFQVGQLWTDRFETVARFEHLFLLDDTTDPALVSLVDRAAHHLGGGLNFYVSGHAFKVQADYDYAFGSTGRGQHTARLQVDASF